MGLTLSPPGLVLFRLMGTVLNRPLGLLHIEKIKLFRLIRKHVKKNVIMDLLTGNDTVLLLDICGKNLESVIIETETFQLKC